MTEINTAIIDNFNLPDADPKLGVNVFIRPQILFAGHTALERNITYTPYDISEKHGENIKAGNLPELGGNFSFVLDTRPNGNQHEHIPAQEFTEYFSNRKVPIAAPGQLMFGHDITHINAYQVMFRSMEFADMVQSAARNAMLTPNVNQFTDAMDNFGECYGDLVEDVYYRGKYCENYVTDATALLTDLHMQAYPPEVCDDAQRGVELDKLRHLLQLDMYEELAS